MNKEKRMTVKEFVDKYNELQNDQLKEKQIESIIKRNYAPITEKKAALDLMFNKCIKEKDGVEYVDSFLMQIGLMSVILALYTNIDCDNSNAFDNYDLLVKNEIYPMIICKIGEKEIKELKNIYSYIEETFLNQQTFEAFFAKQITRFGELFGHISNSGLNALTKVLNNEEKINKIIKTLTETKI